jgi:hypothetical protein
MKLSRLLVALTAVNLAILLFAAVRVLPKIDEAAPVLRGRALQIVDEQGHVRASISVLPAQTQPNGETYPETVLLRLITERGRPSVKISASEETAGATFAGPAGETDREFAEAEGRRRRRDADQAGQVMAGRRTDR